MSKRYIEMFWRCSSCNHRNLGRHQVCQRCKNPKDGSEPYEMPENTAAAVSVTDASLLRMATAGPNWRCAWCESDQRALDGSCKNCGAALPPSPPAAPGPDKGKAADTSSKSGCMYLLLAAVVFGCCCPVVCAGEKKKPKPPVAQQQAAPPVEVKRGPEWTRALEVKEVAWWHSVHIDRYHKVAHEGFKEARPADAVDVKYVGRRHHHDEQVSDGYETVYYTERVRDGYDTETYEEEERCGEDCTDTPESCRESCTSNGNGFATCSTTCSGGGRSCTPRYCSVTHERKVPRYVDKRRSRKEPRFRTVSRDAEWYTWNEWEWTYDRTVKASGTTHKTHWPKDSELRPANKLLEGEQERSERVTVYRVVFQGVGLEPVTYDPATLEEFKNFTPGSLHTLQKEDGKVSVLPPEGPAPPPAKAPAPKSKPKPKPKPKP